MNKTDFAGLLCSRLCHDLVSPVGAISNGVELLADKNNADMQEQIVELLEDSSAQTTNKLKFFRLAFGLAGGYGAIINVDDAKVALAALFGTGKISIDWQTTAVSAPKDLIKILLNLALVSGESIIGTGDLSISLDEEGQDGCLVSVTASGGRLIMNDSVKAAVIEPLNAVDADPKSVPICLARMMCDECGYLLNIQDPKEGEITFTVSKKE